MSKICVKVMLAEYLRDKGMDGLCNPLVPCSCSANDLVSCDELGDGMDCYAYYAKAYESDEDCERDDCEKKGERHFHNETDLRG